MFIKKYGWERFRNIEQDIFNRIFINLNKLQNKIIALGGGII